MLNVALTSDFPSTLNEDVVVLIRAAGPSPRVGWIAPLTATARERFPAAQATFRELGVDDLEYVDIDAAPDPAKFALLDRYDVVYLTGGDPIVFRHNLHRVGLAPRLQEFAGAGRLIVGASGGAMQLTANVSIFRLLSASVEDVVSTRADGAGLGLVECEILPHLNRHDAAFFDKVTKYSEYVPHDVIALGDGAALVCSRRTEYRCLGQGVRYRRGQIMGGD